MKYKIEPGADLSGADLRWADLRWADLCGADLRDADLSGAELRDADLRGADLRWAYLRGAYLRGANLSGVDLTGVDLRRADLSGANLSGANLWDTIGDGKRIKTIQTETYHINIYDDRIQIGCENHSVSDWFGFDDATIDAMDSGKSLNWWREWKPKLLEKLNETR